MVPYWLARFVVGLRLVVGIRLVVCIRPRCLYSTCVFFALVCSFRCCTVLHLVWCWHSNLVFVALVVRFVCRCTCTPSCFHGSSFCHRTPYCSISVSAIAFHPIHPIQPFALFAANAVKASLSEDAGHVVIILWVLCHLPLYPGGYGPCTLPSLHLMCAFDWNRQPFPNPIAVSLRSSHDMNASHWFRLLLFITISINTLSLHPHFRSSSCVLCTHSSCRRMHCLFIRYVCSTSRVSRLSTAVLFWEC